jgi:branched-chain amino acid transport system permease protein
MIAMFALTRTPLGRMANAVRDNPERAKFIGYNTTRVRWLMMSLASFFAGIGGGLAAINYEIVTAETLGLVASGNVVLMAFIGGIGQFWGPIIGAVLVTLLQSALSNYTQAWLLYFGLFFLVIIMFSPGGIANLIALHQPVWKAGLLRRLFPSYPIAAIAGLVMLAGFFALIEMIYHYEAKETSSKAFSYFGLMLDPMQGRYWIACAVVFVLGIALVHGARAIVGRTWDNLTLELQKKGAV